MCIRDRLKAANIQVAEIDSEDEFIAAKLNELNMHYLPEQVFIEYNGTWGIDKIIEAELPKGWVIAVSYTHLAVRCDCFRGKGADFPDTFTH